MHISVEYLTEMKYTISCTLGTRILALI